MSNLRISELDFDEIKTNLKNYLKAQTEFSDYDFEGSGLSVLLDILAYNTHYNAYLANMLANEMFLDSSVKRSSAVSLAKHLGYTARSTRSARAVLDVIVNNPTGNPSSLTMDRYTPFSVSLDGEPYTFYNINAETTTPENGVYRFPSLEVVEGTPINFTFVVSDPGPAEKFEIPSSTVDTSTIVVTVQESTSNTTTTSFTLANDITNLDGDSAVYFLEESPFERYQIFFGDGILGKKLSVGNIVNVRYLSSSADLPNSSNTTQQSFTTTTIGGSNDIDVITVTNPYGGSVKETISSIKFNAPRFNAAKNRAVTSSDYEALISSNFTEAEAVKVWGGEENNPPVYGKVFVCLKPFDGFFISQAAKDNVRTLILDNKKVLAIQPEFVDPIYFYVNLNVTIEYNSLVTTKNPGQIKTNVEDVINDYFNTELKKFNRNFNKSKLIRLITDADSSIETVILKVKLQRRYTLFLNTTNSFVETDKVVFQNAVVPGTFASSRFFVESNNTQALASMIDIPNSMPPDENGTGTIRIINSTNGTTISSNIGTINYGIGEVVINQFIPTALPNAVNDLRFTVAIQESDHNLEVFRNELLVIDDSVANSIVGREAGLTVNVTATA